MSGYSEPPYELTATPYRVSTITVTACAGTEIDLEPLFQHVPIREGGQGVVFAEYGRVKTERMTRGAHPKGDKKSKQTSKRFDNQTTLVVGTGKSYVNVKVFRNGNLQATGIKDIDEGRSVMRHVVDVLVDTHRVHPVLSRPDEALCSGYAVRLINSDFRFNAFLRREVLHQRLIAAYPRICCSYEPCIYPGVKIEYHHNPDKPFQVFCAHEGRNPRTRRCPACSKVTIAVFRSGCVIVTGAQRMEQVDEAYAFIVDFVRARLDDLQHMELHTM